MSSTNIPRLSDIATSATPIVSNIISTTANTTSNTLQAVGTGASQFSSKYHKHFHSKKYNQVMLFYIFIIILFVIFGAKIIPSHMTLEAMGGSIYGFVIGIILCKILWILFGSGYVESDDDMMMSTPPPSVATSTV